MKFAAVDIGNTAVKCCMWVGEADGPRAGTEPGPLEMVAEKIREAEIGRVGYATTRDLTPEECRLVTEQGWWEFKVSRPLPIKIKYGSASTLGVDRVAAALGAWGREPGKSMLIADVGTALTLDLLTREGEYLGGNISPGIALRLRALHEHTSRLPLLSAAKEAVAFGSDTASALRCGALWGVASEIGAMFRLAEGEYGCEKIMVTGGGAPYIMEALRRVIEVTHSARQRATDLEETVAYFPWLVEEGIKIAYETNNEGN